MDSKVHKNSMSHEDTEAVVQALNAHRHRQGALLPVLHSIQALIGYVPSASVALIAQELNLSEADVHGVISFYHDFRHSPPGAHVIQVCRAESCQSLGANALAKHACSHLGVDFHQTTRDNNFTLEPVYCLGNCMNSPAIRVDDEIYGEMTDEKFDDVIDQLLTQVIEVKAP
ncbi:formate dehydrogenase subunit gamma [Enterovibrio nigricans]|uniref:NADH-quinone oxidoreductase subunit E n=1 Tax=Enterovibrio nigricans DSM 22720 TaxID=1121868 RepID=A0A1T4VG88_9GAMM|nr:formate dehydrogenase subunit gamma [Enterovibrio nigricans]SKA63913.1 formate dehydrogenase subunit gamma [Enterovibrio nigricans DSM 22720]